MVLQQETTLPVWGWADPGEKIAVSFGKTHGGSIAVVMENGGSTFLPCRTELRPIAWSFQEKIR